MKGVKTSKSMKNGNRLSVYQFHNLPHVGQSKIVRACFRDECICLHTAVSSWSLGQSGAAETGQPQARVAPLAPAQSEPDK